MATTNDDIAAKNKEILDVKEQIKNAQKQMNDYHNKVDELKSMRQQWNETHKAFFEKRYELIDKDGDGRIIDGPEVSGYKKGRRIRYEGRDSNRFI